jgi:hypothetical protein
VTVINLKEGAERRAARYHQLGAIYGIPATQTAATDWDPQCKVIATATGGETLTIRVIARHGSNGRIVTVIQAWTVSPADIDGSFIKTNQIVSWFQKHATRNPHEITQ